MKLSYQGIQDKQGYAAAQVALPQYDWAKMAEKTAEKPVWVHFGAGNIFRGFIAGLQQRLLNAGLAESGIVAAETFDYDIIDKIYVPHDSMTLMVSLKADGSTQKEVIASIAKGIKANCADEAQWQQLTDVFTAPSLQMASFTITEKGYALRNMKGELMPVVVSDMENGPKQAHHAMAVVAGVPHPARENRRGRAREHSTARHRRGRKDSRRHADAGRNRAGLARGRCQTRRGADVRLAGAGRA